ncbi:MAG: translation elongation factor Ts [Calditrichales bacterium]|nr:translation elongation factor Ts [Calditrichales bacterium]
MAEITAAMVKDLREKTAVGMMDCKKALTEAEGDVEKAVEILRKKGIAKAAKRVDRAANEGIIASYIHPGSKLGVLVEINCETDFVANTDNMKDFTKNIAMHIAAANPLVIRREELDQADIDKEKDIYKDQAQSSGKPDHIIDKIVQGRVEKYYQEVCLIEQDYIKDPEKTINDLLTETISKVGENVTIKHFARFRIGK